uniref:Peptidase A1 domain-containing protein n=1 Tax=Ascaris lumbricoides TaxID=6252 RepID=A0A0M3IPL7_ASCLU
IPISVFIGYSQDRQPTTTLAIIQTETPTTIITSDASTTPQSSAENDYIRGAIFGNSLIYVDILMKNGVGFDAAHNCLDLFPQKSDFGGE